MMADLRIRDDDEISLTSTVSEQYDEEQEFQVDRVLAEKTVKGKNYYLLSWEDYPEEASTWEPEEHIDESVIEAWRERQSLERPDGFFGFDVKRLELKQRRIAEEKARRHARRNEKRKRLGIPISSTGSDADNADDSESSVEERNDIDDISARRTNLKRKATPPKQKARVPPVRVFTSGTSMDQFSVQKVPKSPSSAIEPIVGRSYSTSNSVNRTLDRAQNSRTTNSRSSSTGGGNNTTLERRPASSSRPPLDAPVIKQRRLVQGRRSSILSSSSTEEPLSFTRPKPSTTASSIPPAQRGSVSSRDSLKGVSSIRGGRGATRGAIQKNVFAMSRSSTAKSARPNLVTNASKSSITPAIFSTKRKEYKAQVQGREKADAAPNISAIPGGLFDPSASRSIEPIRPATLRKGTNEFNACSDLFVSDSGNRDLGRPAPRVSTLGYQQATPTMSICYFWHRNQRMPETKACDLGTACKYLHAYREGATVAPAPLEKLDSSPTCFFWDRKQKDSSQQGCDKGDACMYLHEYREGAPVAPAPTGWVPPPTRQPPPRRQESYVPPSSIPTCFFWDRQRRDNSQQGCDKGDTCTFNHCYTEGVPVAPPPLGAYVPPECLMPPPRLAIPQTSMQSSFASNGCPRKSTCFFWDMWKRGYASSSCNKSDDDCEYFHEYRPGAPVATPPYSYRGSRPPPLSHDYLAASPSSATQSMRGSVSSEVTKASSSSSRPVSASNHTQADRFETQRQLTVHSPVKPQLKAGRPPDPSDPRDAVCYMWLHDACNEISETCKYLHVNHKHLPISLAPGQRPPWNWKKPYHSICHFYWTKNNCTKPDCPYFHTRDEWLPLSPAPNVVICRDLLNYGKCTSSNCRFAHPAAANTPSEDFNMIPIQSRGSKSVKFADDEPTIEQQFSFPEPDVASHSTQQPLPDVGKPKRKITIDDYQQRKASVDTLPSQGKKVFFGNEETKPLLLEFKDIRNAKSNLFGEKWDKTGSIKFSQRVLAQDFEAQNSIFKSRRLQELPGSVHVVSGDLNELATSTALSSMSDELSLMPAGLLAVLEAYSMNAVLLVYPAHKEEWKFLEGTAECPADVKMRYAVYRFDFDVSRLFGTRYGTPLVQPYKMTMIAKLHGLELSTLLPHCPKPEVNPYNFFLLFPETAKRSEDLITSWIKSASQNKKLAIHSSRDEGAWRYFHNALSSTFRAGVILVHESVATDIYQLPSLFSIVNNGENPISFWCISDSDTPYPAYPSRYSPEPSELGRVRATQLFPRGGVFLVTPSFLVAEPKKALHLFQWFLVGNKVTRAKYKGATARTWKLVGCHKLADYIMRLALAKTAEKEEFEAKNQDNPMKDAMLMEKGLNYETLGIRFELHNILVKLDNQSLLEPLELSSDSDDPGYESDASDDCERPFVYADRSIDPDDEAALIKWFVSYSIRKLDRFKKFVVVGTDAKSAPRATRTIEVSVKGHGKCGISSSEPASTARKLPDSNGDTIMGNGIESQDNDGLSSAVVAVMNPTGCTPATARAYLMQAGNIVQQAIAAFNRAEKESAEHPSISGLSKDGSHPQHEGEKSRPSSSGSNASKSSRSSITTAANGQRFVPRSVRATDNSISKEIKVKPGFTPIEDTERYRHSNAEGSAPNSRRGSTAMDLDSDPETPSTQLLEEQSEVMTKEIRFEATTEWYRKLVEQQGYAWEHIYIEGHEKTMKNLGVH